MTPGSAGHRDEAGDLTGLIERIDETAEQEQEVTLEDVVQAAGVRSYGPMLVLGGLVILAPLIGDLPGIPTVVALVTLIVSAQMLIGRDEPWLPGWALRRRVDGERLRKVLRKLRKPSAWIDRLLRPRLRSMVEGRAQRVIAAACCVVALCTPALELVPFSANLAGGALLAFGLAVVSRDGLVALIAFAFVTALAGVAVLQLL